jgi:hypothetical protein
MDAATFVAQGRSVAAATSDLPRPWRWVDVGASGYLTQSFEWMPEIEASEAAHALSRAEEQEQEEDEEGLLAESGASLDVEAELGDAQSLCAPGAAGGGGGGGGGVGALRSEVHAVLSPVYSQPLLLFSLAEARTGVRFCAFLLCISAGRLKRAFVCISRVKHLFKLCPRISLRPRCPTRGWRGWWRRGCAAAARTWPGAHRRCRSRSTLCLVRQPVHSIGRPASAPKLFLSASQPRPADGGGGDAQGRPGTRCTAARRRR